LKSGKQLENSLKNWNTTGKIGLKLEKLEDKNLKNCYSIKKI